MENKASNILAQEYKAAFDSLEGLRTSNAALFTQLEEYTKKLVDAEEALKIEYKRQATDFGEQVKATFENGVVATGWIVTKEEFDMAELTEVQLKTLNKKGLLSVNKGLYDKAIKDNTAIKFRIPSERVFNYAAAKVEIK